MRCFFDTNVLVYLFDADAPAKKAIARKLFAESVAQGNALLSIQVLQEFFVAVIRKLGTPLSHNQAEQVVRALSVLPMVEPNAGMVLDAIVASHRYRLSFWDGLIVQAALRGGATVLYSEDLQHGQVFETLTVQNPFA
jgi:predicted nucleic acid-binding protein